MCLLQLFRSLLSILFCNDLFPGDVAGTFLSIENYALKVVYVKKYVSSEGEFLCVFTKIASEERCERESYVPYVCN